MKSYTDQVAQKVRFLVWTYMVSKFSKNVAFEALEMEL
jgi:hypothetical protein